MNKYGVCGVLVADAGETPTLLSLLDFFLNLQGEVLNHIETDKL